MQGYLAKVITGVRRSEKSVLLKKIMEELLANGIDLNKEIKSRIRDDEKYYAIDMGFRTINTNTINFEDSLGHST